MNIREALMRGYEILKEVEIDTYILDTQLLLAHVLEKDKLYLTINSVEELREEDDKKFFELVEKRKKYMPIKYITEECEFMGMNFYVSEGVLIPRADTEVLVEEVLKEAADRGDKAICDVCCGSGIIGISLAMNIEDSTVKMLDISDDALRVSKINIERFNVQNRVDVLYSDLLTTQIEESAKFDIVVSNPPYINAKEMKELMPDVANYEPHLALAGNGEDGADFYREITRQSLEVLKKGGLLAYEIGYNQGEVVKTILEKNGFSNVRVVKDLAGLDRVVLGRFE